MARIHRHAFVALTSRRPAGAPPRGGGAGLLRLPPARRRPLPPRAAAGRGRLPPPPHPAPPRTRSPARGHRLHAAVPFVRLSAGLASDLPRLVGRGGAAGAHPSPGSGSLG